MNPASAPLVSILIPVYNREAFVAEAIHAACTQDWPAIEVIVVDNCSTDGTFNVASDAASHDPRIRVYQNKTNLGPVANWGRCLELASGEIGKFLWSDDSLVPTFISRAMACMAPSIGFVATSFRFSGDESHVCHWMDATGTYPVDAYVSKACLVGGGLVSPALALFRMADLKRFFTPDIPNPFGLDFKGCGAGPDVLFFLEACRVYPFFAYIREPLAVMRAHSGAISAMQRPMVAACYGWALLDFLDRCQPRWSAVRNRLLSRLTVDPRLRHLRADRQFSFDSFEAYAQLRFLASEGWRAFKRRCFRTRMPRLRP